MPAFVNPWYEKRPRQHAVLPLIWQISRFLFVNQLFARRIIVQRFSIVKRKAQLAFLHVAMLNPRLLLLDEVTASLDAGTEKTVLGALRAASEGRTVISISHRLYETMGGRTEELV